MPIIAKDRLAFLESVPRERLSSRKTGRLNGQAFIDAKKVIDANPNNRFSHIGSGYGNEYGSIRINISEFRPIY